MSALASYGEGTAVSPKLREELLQQMALLPEEQQKQVLAFAKTLACTRRSVREKSARVFGEHWPS